MFFTKIGRITAQILFFGGLVLILLGLGILVAANLGSDIAPSFGWNEYFAFVAYTSGFSALLVGLLLGILTDISTSLASARSATKD